MTQKMINLTHWSDGKIQQALQVWAEYQQSHDLSDRHGEAAGIDPETGEVWLGCEISDIVKERKAKGLSSPLLFERIGFPTYYRKGGRR